MYRLVPKFVLFLSLCCCTYTVSQAQLLQDAATQQLLHQALDKIYNFEFTEAAPLIKKIRDQYPQHPVYPLLVALRLSWEGMPLRKDKPTYGEYIRHLQLTLTRANALLDKNGKDPEAIFFALSAHSYLALQASEEGQSMEALSEARRAYGYLRAGMKLTSTYVDFYLSTGLYNYYVKQYPETHPAIKPLMLFFADGDKKLGLQQLETGANKGVFTKTEALYYLMHISVKHEMQFAKGLVCSSRLNRQYPNNLLFLMRHTEMLVLNGRYDEAKPFLGKISVQTDPIYQATAAVLQGLMEEKGAHNYEKAQSYYLKAIKLKAFERRYTQDYYGMAYAGLARLAAREGNKVQAKAYYKKALELAEYESTIREAKHYLKNA